MNNYLQEAQSLSEYTCGLRRDFHQHPEIGFNEIRTAEIIAKELTELGLKVQTGVGQTGVVGLLTGKQPGGVVLLRFDMDALPVDEETGAEYASIHQGLMHACGHDGHVAVGLTVARILSQHKSEFDGTVKFMFQPAEEGLGGAQAMIKDEVLDHPKPDVALGMHVWNEKPAGWIGVVPGPVMAAADTFTIKIIGKGGHGASPNQTNDPIVAAAQVISSLQTIVSRNIPPVKTAVVTVASIHAGEAFNIIPAEVLMKGTIRTFESEIRERVIARFGQIVKNIAQGLGCEANYEVNSITPAVVNDPAVAGRVQQVVRRVLPKHELDSQDVTMGSEDMAFVMQQIPGCYVFIGSANPSKHLDAPHHSAKFDFDEKILPEAAGLMATCALEFLQS